MSKLVLRSGEDISVSAERFVDAWERAERCESVVSETHVTFDSLAGLAALLSSKRVELLRYVHRAPVESVAALARGLDRDYNSVREDVAALAEAGLIDRQSGAIRAEYADIQTALALYAASRDLRNSIRHDSAD